MVRAHGAPLRRTGQRPEVPPGRAGRRLGWASAPLASAALLDAIADGHRIGRPVAIVVAQPGDEVLGLGSRLRCFADLALVHVTDGAPRDLADARRAGCATEYAYGALRRRELDEALAALRVRPTRRHAYGYAERETAEHLTTLTRRLTNLLAGAEAVVAPAYEGGHPDHDSVAFAVQHACRSLLHTHGRAPVRLELPTCHDRRGDPMHGSFWPAPDAPERHWTLSSDEERAKRAALDRLASQRTVIASFPTAVERVRLAPRYDFTAPPPPGAAPYDRRGWQIDSAGWRRRAGAAEASIGHGGGAR